MALRGCSKNDQMANLVANIRASTSQTQATGAHHEERSSWAMRRRACSFHARGALGHPALGLNDEAAGDHLRPKRLLHVAPGADAEVARVADDLDVHVRMRGLDGPRAPARGIQYTLNGWETLIRYREDGRLPPDTDFARLRASGRAEAAGLPHRHPAATAHGASA